MKSGSDITEGTLIADVLRDHPECIEVFDRHEMPCRTCMGAATGTIGDGALMHGIDVEVILRELRECCGKQSSAQGT